jgi:hypothetical protein
MLYVDPLSHLYAVIQPINRAYFSQTARIRTTTVELRNPVLLESYLQAGFVYIRRLEFKYEHIMREPTNGCHVELTKEMDFGSMPINSVKARRLIRRISYF